jgi:diacylglycerol kinase (ATP)
MTCLNSIVILSNPSAGKGRAKRVTAMLISKLDQLNFNFEHHSSDWPARLEKYSSVFVIGGDGTLNFFINKYKDIKIPIAIFKGGSGNDFAWKLYGNISPSEYLDRILSGSILKVDAGSCNDHLFLNGFGIGFDGAIVQAMGSRKKVSAGHLAYLLSVIKNILFFQERQVHLKIDHNIERVVKPFLIAVANGERYGGGFKIAPKAIINDGKLDMILIKEMSPFQRLWKIPVVQKGRHLSLPIVEYQLIKNVIINPTSSLAAHCDGEAIAGTFYQISILPGQYRFFN